MFNGVWGNDFYDVCQTAKIIVAPQFPEDDFYWSDRIYRVLGAGGFLIHPRLYGLKQENFENKKHYITYHTWNELVFHLEHFLKPEYDKERRKIAQQGKEFVLKHFTYNQRLKEIFKKI